MLAHSPHCNCPLKGLMVVSKTSGDSNIDIKKL